MSRHFGRIASAFCVVALSVLALVHMAQSCALDRGSVNCKAWTTTLTI